MDAAAPRPGIDQNTFVDWDYGFDFYACQSFVDEQGRTILIGWMSLPHDEHDDRPYDNPTATWRGCLTVPRVLTLNEAGRICQAPAAEIDALRRERVEIGPDGISVEPKVADVVLTGIEGDGVLRFGDFLELRVEGGELALAFTDDAVGQGRKLRRAHAGAVRDIRVLVDTSVLEIFVNGGEVVFGTRYFSESDEIRIEPDFPAWTGELYFMDEVTVNYLVTR